ncbi:hypothetical protein CC80DRAFT_545544 [Byssothecium circinans]|uniref:Uncharacterized protein n=1 Tax=Byssothecium circinans TaxID=147558 RepID=A0A6A5UDG5_9PLEO|nr:hypothetical protein CC80DRAFT_545544 [Byssothecium circinans]
MAPTLRQTTKAKTRASEEDSRPWRHRVPRHKLFPKNKGLVSLKTPKWLAHATIANATHSPLLRLPAELRTRIFQYAMSVPNMIILPIGQRHTYGPVDDKLPALHLPGVCRQIYSETATMAYGENCFSFWTSGVLLAWLSKRTPAQQEAVYTLQVGGWLRFTQAKKAGLEDEVKKICPKLREIAFFGSEFLGMGWSRYTGISAA